MAQRVNGFNPLAYLGVKPSAPTQMVIKKRRPLTSDLKNFQLGTWWIIPTLSSSPTNEVWILINKTATTATWIEVDSGGGVVIPGAQYSLLTADGSGTYGPEVGPGSAGQVLLSEGSSDYADFITPTVSSGLAVTANANTLEYSLNISEHALIVGDGASGVKEIAPSATAGIPLISVGSSSSPKFSTASVEGGGTGVSTMTTAYAPVCAGTTPTGALQVASGDMSNAGHVLTSTGSSSLPVWLVPGSGVNLKRIVVRKFTSVGTHTYTPTKNMSHCIVELVGGGGSGGSVNVPEANQRNGAGGGGAGYCRKLFDAATIGSSQTVTIGRGNISRTSQATGSSFGSFLSANHGLNGTSSLADNPVGVGGAGGLAFGGDVNIPGHKGQAAFRDQVTTNISTGKGLTRFSGAGGNSFLGMGGGGLAGGPNTILAGLPGTGYGSGGSGALVNARGIPNISGGTGADGICIITEFIK